MNLPLQLDRAAATPLQDQLFEQLRQLILTGRLKPNSRIIATRFLAEQAGVSRRTVLFAYERLIAEGYLETRPAIGTFVSPTPPDQRKPAVTDGGLPDLPRQSQLHPTDFHSAVPQLPLSPHTFIDFSPARQDDSHLLPAKVWLREIREALMAEQACFAAPAPAAGVEMLRQVIADHLAATRGILTAPEQIVIVSGRLHACALIAHLFQHRDDRVLVESPGDEQIAGFFRTRHAEIIAGPVDEHGLDPAGLPQGPVALAYVTPARQNPIGGTLLASRRAPLIEWARNAGAYLIEDDGDSDLRYQGAAPPPLITMDPYGLVFYMGSFARRLGAGFNLAYLVVPTEFCDAVVAIKSFGSEGGQWLEQMAMANLLASGEYDHHLRRLRKIYLDRRDALAAALSRHFPSAHLIGTESGTQMTWMLPDHFPPAAEVRAAALAAGVNVPGLEGAAPSTRFGARALIFGYAALEPEMLQQGVAMLARAVGRLNIQRFDRRAMGSQPA
jgi:GntR family transcriptional regulator/MocR family aminotransferase